MKKNRFRSRPRVEQLEDRWCPSLVFSYNPSNLTLTVSGSSTSGSISISEPVANEISITAGAQSYLSPVTQPVSNLTLSLSGANATTFDLLGNLLKGNVNATLSAAAASVNTLAIQSTLSSTGTIGGSVTVGVSGSPVSVADKVTLGDTLGDPIAVNGSATVNLGNVANSELDLDTNALVKGNLTTTNVNIVKQQANMLVYASETFNGGTVGSSIDDAGMNGGNLVFNGPRTASTASSSFTEESTGSIGCDFQFTAYDSRGSSVDLEGKVTPNTAADGNNFYTGDAETDSLTVGASAVDSGKLTANLVNGTDTVNILGTVNKAVSLTLGTGTDSVTIGGTPAVVTTIGGALSITSSGNDTVTLGDAAGDPVNLGSPTANVSVNLHNAPGASLTLDNNVTLEGNLTTYSAAMVTQQASCLVYQSATFDGGSVGTDVDLSGQFGGNVDFFGPSSSSASGTLTIEQSCTVGCDLFAEGEGYSGFALDIEGQLTTNPAADGKNYYEGTAGNDSLTVGQYAVVNGSLTADLFQEGVNGTGNKTVNLLGTIGDVGSTAQVLTINSSGAGTVTINLGDSNSSDSLTINGTAQLNLNSDVDDEVTYYANATANYLTATATNSLTANFYYELPHMPGVDFTATGFNVVLIP